MILPLDNVCWVQTADGRSIVFDDLRLAASIRRAAAAAGLTDWWPAEAVAEAVREAVRETSPQRRIRSGDLALIVAHMLTQIGCDEIAVAYERRHEYAEIRLDRLADPVHGLAELDFFAQLDVALRIAAKRELAAVHLRGLRACVMRLRGARRWTANCQRLADEIIVHLRGRVVRARPRNAGELRLVVTG